MTGRSRRTRRIAGALALPMFLVVVLVGCEFIVSNDLPTYTCTGTDPTSCPSGMFCDPTSSTCRSSSDPVPEGGPLPERVDTETGPAPLLAMGKNCTADKECQSGLCGTPSVLTSAILDQGSVCTTPCCTTADCPAQFICYAPATGGNFCVAAERAERTPPTDGGGAKSGATCVASSDCRSGMCDSDGHCSDTCCTNDDCNGSTVCKLVDLTGPGSIHHTAWACATPNPAPAVGDGVPCGGNPDCQDSNCVLLGGQNTCDPVCCSSNDCTKVGANFVCSYGKTSNNDNFKECFSPRLPDAGAEGASCPSAKNSDCATDFCDSTHKCAKPCCRSSDCSTGESCKPDDLNFLRCVKASP
jgi:hypothetical protein